MRVLRRLHDGLPLRRHSVARHPPGPAGHGEPGALQGRWTLLCEVPTGAIALKHFTDEEVFHQRSTRLCRSRGAPPVPRNYRC